MPETQWKELTPEKFTELGEHKPTDVIGLCFYCKEWVTATDDYKEIMEMDVHAECFESARAHLAKILEVCYAGE